MIVPLAPGEDAWPALLPVLAGLPGSEVLLAAVAGAAPQVPVVHGHASMPVRVVASAAGRARQQNAAAALARGELLWFLHADSLPDATALQSVAQLPHGFDALGWFKLRFHDGGGLHRLNAVGANLRSRWLALPYGDQGLLLPAVRFAAFGGFDERLPRGEDLDLVVRARHSGLPLSQLGGCVATSARRYREEGWARTTAAHLRLGLRLRREAIARLQRASR